MSKEEKEAVEELKEFIDPNTEMKTISMENITIISNLIEKQQKEIEYWKKRTKYYEEQEREKADLETEIRFYRDSFTN